MKTKLPLLLAILLPLVAHAADDLSTALQKGLFEEEANQNLPAAIQAYQSLLAASDDQRKLAATALFRLGECYRKLGQTNDAIAQYRRLIRDFTDQTTLATLSRQNLTGLGVETERPRGKGMMGLTFAELLQLNAAQNQVTTSTEGSASALDAATRAKLKTLLQEEIQLAEKLLSEQRKRVETGTMSVGESVRFERDVLGLKRQLVAADGLFSPEARQRWRELMQEEIALAEQAVQVELKKVENGKQTPVEVSRAQRELMSLKRELITFDATPAPAVAAPAANTSTDEEQNEIRRIQAIIKDSPDLINAPNVEVKLVRSSEVMIPRNGTLLHKAASLGQLRVATFLLDHGADIGARDQGAPQNTPLHWAAVNGHRAMVELLLSRKADPNAILIPDGSTPLLLATRKSFRSVCEALLARGANPNLPDSASEAPLDTAASRGDEAIVRLLLDKGAEVNRKSKSGTTSLHRTSSTNIARLLLERGAEANAQDEQGRSPLFGAAERDQRDLLQFLLAQNADTKLASKIGWTPLHAASPAT